MKKLSAVMFMSLATVMAAVACSHEAGAQDPKKPATPKVESGTATKPAVPTDSTKDAACEAIDQFIATAKVDKSSASWKTTLKAPPKQGFDPKKSYYWVLETNKGNIKVKFLPDVAPMHVTSAIYLTKLGFFDGLSFHRVIPGFMAQGGCPMGNGRGNPGYQFAGEFSPTVRHDRPGLLSMANAGPGTDGSQFFLTFVKTPHLDGKHTIYGEIVEGLDTTMKKLEEKGSRSGATQEALTITKATIEVK